MSEPSSNFSYEATITPNTFVVLNIEETSAYYPYQEKYEETLGVKNGGVVLCLGEITNMPHHFVFVNKKTNTIVTGLHCDLFRPATEDDL